MGRIGRIIDLTSTILLLAQSSPGCNLFPALTNSVMMQPMPVMKRPVLALPAMVDSLLIYIMLYAILLRR